ncbi:MAG: hypothetical protein ABFR97_00930 [Thermodesulfobacteriota bacterium]
MMKGGTFLNRQHPSFDIQYFLFDILRFFLLKTGCGSLPVLRVFSESRRAWLTSPRSPTCLQLLVD